MYINICTFDVIVARKSCEDIRRNYRKQYKLGISEKNHVFTQTQISFEERHPSPIS